ncbi:MAG: hypothetical protein P8Y23_14410 [Candidatus Lokiarchaeota archaeon]|jgi:hypothetical protein
MLAEWVNIYISYSPLYWIQLGYAQYWTRWIFPPFPYVKYDFYLERMDAYGRWITVSLFSPITDHLYIYELYYDLEGAPYVWHTRILEGQSAFWTGSSSTNPATCIDIAALVETSHTGVDIDDSHFSNLKYYDNSNWYYWSLHYSYSTPNSPYSVQTISHYEFYASGGG